MSDNPFYRTIMGQRFYEATMPSLVRELSRLNTNVERLVAAVERLAPAPAQAPAPAPAPAREGENDKGA